MKFFGLTLISALFCLMLAGCSDSVDQSELPPPPPAPSETKLGDASGSPEDMFNDSASENETAAEDGTETETK